MSARKALVRRATPGDVARFVELGLRFYAEEGGREACPRQLARFAFSHLEDDNRIFLVAGEPVAGFLCGVLTPHYFTGEANRLQDRLVRDTGCPRTWSPSPARVRGLGQG